ncbi:alpha-glucan family phosphorylase [Chloroflexota bacterium]
MINVKLPERISRLEELANNLWWSWHKQARQVFRALDYPLWKESGHNPVKQLSWISPERLAQASADPAFLAIYDSVMVAYDEAMSPVDHTWLQTNYPNLLSGPVAYFSMEYAIHNSLPIYAGGLGVLAGDICKEASDLGLPMVAIGFMYPQGYFHQHISISGWQEEEYQDLNFDEAPINQVLSPSGDIALTRVRLGDVDLTLCAWHVKVGRTDIYLLDTQLEENLKPYQQLSARLYVSDKELRLQQEIALGIGGVRVLRALGINPAVWHANEGHSAFMTLERVREKVAEGMDFTEAQREVRKTTVFTTHTPVMAGHDIFAIDLVEKYFHGYWEQLGIDRRVFLELGWESNSDPRNYNMTVLALKMADQRNAVSQLHGSVTRKMWHGLWPDIAEDQVPISQVTNGIHVPSWVAPELNHLLAKYLGEDWLTRYDIPHLWEKVLEIPDEALWAVCQKLRRKLVGAIRERMRTRWLEDDIPWTHMLMMGALLDPEVLTIAFARRFTEYKRPALILHDIKRLKQIVTNKRHPVQIIFAGKSHPADMASKNLLQQVYKIAADREFQGRIVFVEDYDMHLARYLVQGVDVWLNVPRRLQEASGSSGMKASLNGVLNLSVLDGWWYEGYNSSNGWVIGNRPDNYEVDTEDKMDAEALYHLLEAEIVPLYNNRDVNGVPHDWIRKVKESIISIVPIFCARRMLKEYTERMYVPAAQSQKNA